MENIKPMGQRVLVKKKIEEKSAGGLIIPDSGKNHAEGVVSALGTGQYDMHGKLTPFFVKVGDKVLFPKHAGEEIKIPKSDDNQYVLLPESQILAVI